MRVLVDILGYIYASPYLLYVYLIHQVALVYPERPTRPAPASAYQNIQQSSEKVKELYNRSQKQEEEKKRRRKIHLARRDEGQIVKENFANPT